MDPDEAAVIKQQAKLLVEAMADLHGRLKFEQGALVIAAAAMTAGFEDMGALDYPRFRQMWAMTAAPSTNPLEIN